MDNDPNSLSLTTFIDRIKADIQNISELYKGLTITELSLPSFTKNTNKAYFGSYYIAAENGNHSVKLLVGKYLIEEAIKEGHKLNEEVSVDIVIDKISIDKRGTILITVSKIVESGVSEQELFIKQLSEYCQKNGYFDQIKKTKPTLIKKIAIISTFSSTIKSDITKNINYSKQIEPFKVHNSSEAIAEQIDMCQGKGFDIILLYRGGHEDKAMNIYSDIPVLDAIQRSDTHIGVALGHFSDNPFVYLIADSTYATPTHFAQETNRHNNEVLQSFKELTLRIHHSIETIKKGQRKTLESVNISNISTVIKTFTDSLLLKQKDISGLQNAIIHKKEKALQKSNAAVRDLSGSQIHSFIVQKDGVATNINRYATHITSSIDNSLSKQHNTNKELVTDIINQKSKALEDYYSKITGLIEQHDNSVEINRSRAKNKKITVITVIMVFIIIMMFSYILFSQK